MSLGVMCTAGVHAQSAGAADAPSDSAMVNLIDMLVQRGVLTKQDGQGLIAKAQREAAQVKAANQAVAVAGTGVANAPTQPGDVAVPYVPQVVRDQITNEVKQQVMAKAVAENWAQPNALPDWLSRIKFYGDMRVRDEYHFYSSRNEIGVTDFAAVNANGGYDVNENTNGALPPQLNTTQDRDNLERVRARFGLIATLSDQITAGLQLASGNDDDPVSTTDTLGGGFLKQDIWLNQAYIRYTPTSWATITGGRFDNPFFSSDLLYSNDLEFDGIAANLRHALPGHPNLTVFGTIGAFPVQYSNDEFPTESEVKSPSDTKWMAGAQFGADWQIDGENEFKAALAYYDFMDMKGQLSAPCALYLGITNCSTDDDAPNFLQKGNTLIELRDILPNPNLAPGLTPQPQLFGLAYNYHLIDGKLQWNTMIDDSLKVRVDGEYVRNVAYDEGQAFAAASTPINNYNNAGAVSEADYRSGGNGYLVKATLGDPETVHRGDWNFSLTYKYLQPDAVLDALDDPDFNLGGTNAKGYIFGAQYGIAKGTWLQARYLSARQVFGPPLLIDVVQLEIDARF